MDNSSSNPTKYTIALHKTKINSVRLEEPYDYTNPMENSNADTHLIDTNENHKILYAKEEKNLNI